MQASEPEIQAYKKSIHRGNYLLNGYTTKESREKYQKIIAKDSTFSSLDEIRPILLPPGVKNVFNPSIGSKMILEDEFLVSSYGHFAGFRSDDLAITVDRRTREEMKVPNNQYYQVEIDPEQNLIKFVGKIQLESKK